MPAHDTPATDPRWVLAVAAARSLEGGRAAILRPECRERVQRLASTLGLRAFDAALVIAIVQDAARRGEPLGGETAARLQMVRGQVEHADPSAGVQLVLSLVLGVAVFVALAALLV